MERFVEKGRAVGPSTAVLIERILQSRRHPELFALPSSIEANRSGRKEFNHFAPDSVYQYAKVPELTMGGLIAAAQEVKRSVDNFASATPASRQS